MIKYAFSLFLVVSQFFSYSQEKSLARLRYQVDSLCHQQKTEFAVAFKDLSTHETLFINEHELFHAASTMKTPVLVEIYKQATSGKFSLNDSLTVKNEFKSIADGSVYSLSPDDDSEFELYKKIGQKVAIHDLVYLMVTVSSNFATNMLIEMVGAKNVTASMRKMGIKDLQVLRGVEDDKAYQKGLNNVVTAYDLMLLFEKIAKRKAVNKKSSDEMIRILLDQHFNEMIPARLPQDVKVAHKTGWIKGINHDSGIVFLPDGREYVLVLLSKNAEDEKAAVNTLATVSEIIYKYVAGL
ncbi:MAG TPA: serine hydrolase [Puia sp.]|nr:serine hydrolase [Puia sp.]